MGWTIVIVEASKADREILKNLFSRFLKDPKTLETSKKEDFTQILKKQLPDLIICDYAHPETTGREFWEIAQTYAPSSPFVYLTEKMDPSIIKETILAESYGTIIKGGQDNLKVEVGSLISRILIDKSAGLLTKPLF